MTPRIKNIIIFASAGLALILIYVFFIRSSSTPADQSNLVSTSGTTVLPSNIPADASLNTQDFLAVLLSVKSIKLDDRIFSDPAFSTLHDSGVVLTPDGTEGRPNPFAPIGSDASIPTTIIQNTNNSQTITPPITIPNSPAKPTTPTKPSTKTTPSQSQPPSATTTPPPIVQ